MRPEHFKCKKCGKLQRNWREATEDEIAKIDENLCERCYEVALFNNELKGDYVVQEIEDPETGDITEEIVKRNSYNWGDKQEMPKYQYECGEKKDDAMLRRIKS